LILNIEQKVDKMGNSLMIIVAEKKSLFV